jgi:hypothetical protein
MSALRASTKSLLSALCVLGCDDIEAYPPGELVLTQGQETDTWSATPVPVRAEVDQILLDGTRKSFATLELPLERFSMGIDTVAAFDVSAFDAQGVPRVRGRSYPLDTPSLAGYTLPLFVGRTGRFSRPPGSLTLEHGQFPPATLYADRLLLVAGQSEQGMVLTEGYDLAFWTVVATPELRCPVDDEVCQIRTLAVVNGTVIVAVGDDWLRSFVVDVETVELEEAGTSYTEIKVLYEDASLPDGLDSFAEIAGGQVVHAPDGDVYLVGATRPESPTSAVLRMLPGSTGTAGVTLRTVRLNTARTGAAAGWSDEYGLVVAGGASDGVGVEALREGDTAFTELPYPADSTTGAGLVAIDPSTVVRVGGRDAASQPAVTVRIALDCEQDCVAETWNHPVDLWRTSVYLLEAGDLLAVGLDGEGNTRAWRLGGSEPESVPLRQPRQGASSLRVTTGHVVVVGGLLAEGVSSSALEFLPP